MKGKRFIIPIFISHFGCPYRCVYCDQHRIARPASALPSPEEVRKEIEWYLRVGVRKRRDVRTIQVAFYGGSFTALAQETQEGLLHSIAPFLREGRVHSLRLSTRPDYISPEIMEVLKTNKVTTVELGVQSMDDEVLKTSRRGYGREEIKRAIWELNQRGFEVGVQLMVGLPGDTPEKFSSTIEEVIGIKPHFVRIYPTLVIKGTVLERWFHEGRYRPISLEEAVNITKGALQRFRQAQIPVIRVGLQPTPSLETKGTIVAGPYHPAFRQLVEGSILYEQAASLLASSRTEERSSPIFLLSPQDISNFYGQGRRNIKRLKEAFGLKEVKVQTDPKRERGTISLCV
ncbi:MAG: radical SAM protein [Deltaproteobacteria bacterium]|nr:radical SAM protein [Deltaproteobacteria bacterium]